MKRVAVVGARGYVGGELAVLLARHPRLSLAAAFSRSLGGTKVGDAMPQLKEEARRSARARDAADVLFSDATPEQVVASRCDVIVLALPNGASQPYVDAVAQLTSDVRARPLIVDVSADGRFSLDRYAYGLPEVGANRESVRKSRLIANPGCYATAGQLGLWPLVRASLLDASCRPPALFGVSGYSGAGSTPSPKTDPVFLNESLLPYSLVNHVHEREVGQQMGVPVHFMPHVAPFFRGIQMTLNVDLNRAVSLDDVRRAYLDAYKGEPLVRVTDEPPRARELANTHGGAVGGFTVAGKRLVVTSAIDNLLKGAASQAVQNINLAMGFDELAGLEPLPASIGAPVAPAKAPIATSAGGVASANTVPCKPCPTVCPTCVTPACKQCFPICASCTDANRFFVNNYARPGTVVLARGEGARLYDTNNTEWLDFTSGIAVNAFGHGDRRWAAVIAEQAAKLAHTSNLLHNEPALNLAKTLVEHAVKAKFDARVFIANSGTEANEAALKISRLSRPGGRFVSFKGSFHGRSMGSLSVTYKPTIRTPFEPLLDCTYLDYDTLSEAELRAAIDNTVAAVIIEPVQGEGGLRVASPQFLRSLRAACDAAGAALIYDEVQCGIGRTGSMFAFEGMNAPVPDILTLAKPLGGGLPCAATLFNQRLASKITPGIHGTTFAGNATVAAAAVDSLARLAQPDLLRNVVAKGERLAAAIVEALGAHCVEVRGRGLMRGIKLAPPLTAAGFVAYCRRQHLLIVGTDDPQIVRVLPHLTVDDADIAIAAKRMAAAAREFVAESTAAAAAKK